jgi:hypothetical protein
LKQVGSTTAQKKPTSARLGSSQRREYIDMQRSGKRQQDQNKATVAAGQSSMSISGEQFSGYELETARASELGSIANEMGAFLASKGVATVAAEARAALFDSTPATSPPPPSAEETALQVRVRGPIALSVFAPGAVLTPLDRLAGPEAPDRLVLLRGR